MRVRIELYGFLRSSIGLKEVTIEIPENINLREALSTAVSQIPQLREAIDPGGELKPYFILFVNGIDYELLGSYDYVVKNGDSIQLLPISHGGSTKPLEEYLDQINSLRVSACVVDENLAEKLLNYVDSVGCECVAQVLPRKYYYGAAYSALIAYLTLRSIKLGLNVSKKKSLEFLLYYFGDRQIGNVLRLLQAEHAKEYVAIYACLSGAFEPGNSFSKVVIDCENPPEEPVRAPEEALKRLSSGMLKILA